MKRLVAMLLLLAALPPLAILFIRPSDATLTFERKLISGEIRIQDAEKHAEVPL